ncbi:MAG: hypothetical protein AABX11_03390 [Nanoarchaeota archaeon]
MINCFRNKIRRYDLNLGYVLAELIENRLDLMDGNVYRLSLVLIT